MSGKDTNGLAKSWHQSFQTLLLVGLTGLGGWCWHLLNSNSNRLITVEDRQNMVLGEHVEFKHSFEILRDAVNTLKEREIRQDDRLDSIEKGNHSKP